jgi:hypothetical protein
MMTAPPLPRHTSNKNNNFPSMLTEQQMNEIQTIFRAFNPSLSGYIDISTFERMCHSLGFRVEQSEIQERILRLANIHIEVGANKITSAPSDERNMHQIDLSMAAVVVNANEGNWKGGYWSAIP